MRRAKHVPLFQLKQRPGKMLRPLFLISSSIFRHPTAIPGPPVMQAVFEALRVCAHADGHGLFLPADAARNFKAFLLHRMEPFSLRSCLTVFAPDIFKEIIILRNGADGTPFKHTCTVPVQHLLHPAAPASVIQHKR